MYQKKLSLVYLVPWKNNFTIKINIESDDLDPWSSEKYYIELTDTSNNTLELVELAKARKIIGVIPIIDKNILLVVYVNYVNDKPCVLIDFLKIDIPDQNNESNSNNESNLKVSINRLTQHKIKSKYSCGMSEGVLCSSCIDSNLFYVCFGDLVNYSSVSFVKFTQDKYEPAKLVEYGIELEPVFDNTFWLDSTYIIFSKAVGHDINIVEFGLFNVVGSKCFSIVTLTLENSHSLDNLSANIEFESKIYDFFQLDGIMNCLARIKLFHRINPLNSKSYFLDVLVKINNKENYTEVLDISNPIFFSNSDDYENYFGVRPYWIKSPEPNGNFKIKIFNQNNYNKLT